MTAELALLTQALKASTLRESVPRLVERAHSEAWSHEEFLAACLQREVAARESHGGEGRARAAWSTICTVQGNSGQRWWHYDSRTDRVVEGYPVYSVHQDVNGADGPVLIQPKRDRLISTRFVRGVLDRDAAA